MSTRRVVGVDAPSISINVPTVSPVKVDLTGAQEMMARAQANQQQTYEAELKGIAAKGEEIQATYQAEARRAEQGASGVAQIVRSIQEGVTKFAELEMQRKEQQTKLQQELRKEQQAQNQVALLGQVQSSLTKAHEYITTTADKEGFYSVERTLLNNIAAADVDPETKARMIQYVSEELRGYQASQLSAIRTEAEKTTEAMVANTESTLKMEMVKYGSAIAKQGLTGEAAGLVVQDAISFLDSQLASLPADIPISSVLNLRARQIDTLSVALGENYDAQAQLQQAATKQKEWEQRAYEIQQQYANDPITRQSLLRALQAEITGEVETKVTTELDVYEEANRRLELLKSIDEHTRPEVEDMDFLRQMEVGRFVYQDLTGQLPLESIKDKPGMGAVYQQLVNARDVVRTNLNTLEEQKDALTKIEQRRIDLQGQVSRLAPYAQMAQNWDSLSDEQKSQLTQAMKDGLIPSDQAKIVADYTTAQQQLSLLEQERVTAMERYNQARAILRPYGFDEGTAGQPQRYQQMLQDAEERGMLQQLAGIDQQEGDTPNFPTRSGVNTPPPRPLPSVGHSQKEQNFVGMPAPFYGVDSNNIYITSTMRNDRSSHSHGHAIDFATGDGRDNVHQVAPLVSGRVTDVVSHHRGTSGEGYGNLVEVTDSQGRRWLYAHLGDVFVREGDMVAQGQPIGKMSATGRSFGVHLHVQVNDSNGAPLPYQQWFYSVKPEVDARNTSTGTGLPPNYTQRTGTDFNTALENLPPQEAIRLPSGAYIYNGELVRSSNDPFLSRLERVRGTNRVENLFTMVNPTPRIRASNQRSAYEPNSPSNNYGYRFIANQNGFRHKLNSVATELGIPAQWLADSIATLTGGTFGRGQRGNRVGIVGFTLEDARRLGLNPVEIANMNHSQQLDLLVKKLEPYKGRFDTLEQFWLSLNYNPEVVMSQQNLSSFVNNSAFRTGVEGLSEVGNLAGREYQTVADLLRLQQPTQQPRTSSSSRVTDEPVGMRVFSTNLSPAEAAFLDGVSYTEGTYKPNGYYTQVGDPISLQRTAAEFNPFTYHSGANSTASGRYQFMPDTWNSYARGLDIRNPEHQDIVALRLVREARNAGAVFTAIETGDFQTFKRLVEGPLVLEWVGLSTKLVYNGAGGRGSTPIDRLWNFVRERYKKYGGR